MQVFAYITSAITGVEMKLELAPFALGVAFAFVDSGIPVQGTYIQHGNKFAALDAMRHIYGDPGFRLRFELV
jgi:hypothetical protein